MTIGIILIDLIVNLFSREDQIIVLCDDSIKQVSTVLSILFVFPEGSDLIHSVVTDVDDIIEHFIEVSFNFSRTLFSKVQASFF